MNIKERNDVIINCLSLLKSSLGYIGVPKKANNKQIEKMCTISDEMLSLAKKDPMKQIELMDEIILDLLDET